MSVTLIAAAQKGAKKKNKQMKGEVRVITVESKNGETVKSDKTYSIKDKEKLSKVLKEQGVDIDFDVKDGKVEINMGDDKNSSETHRIIIKADGDEKYSFVNKNQVKVIKIKEGEESRIDDKDIEVIVEELAGKEGRKIKIKSKGGAVIDEEAIIKQGGDIELVIEDDGEIQISNQKSIFFLSEDEIENIDDLKIMTFIRTNSNVKDSMETNLPKSINETFGEDASLKDLNLFPNPTNGNFKIQFTSEKATDYEINITDPKGALIYQKNLEGFEGEFNEDFDLSRYDAGLYFFNLISDEKTVSKKIIVQ